MQVSTLSMAMPMSIPRPKGRILCVDDEPNIRRALSWLLQKEFEVVTASSGREGLELVRRDNFDVVISDQAMPEMSGVDFLMEVKTAAPRAVRILLTSQADVQGVLHSASDSGIFRYITKPWNVSELPGIVAQAAEVARSQTAGRIKEEEENPPLDAKILILGESPDIHVVSEVVASDLAPMLHVDNVADAIQALKDERIGVIVAEARLGSADLSRLACLVKQKHPEVANVMVGDEAVIGQLGKLIGRGQVYRFLPTPIRGGQLRQTLCSALAERRITANEAELEQRPAIAELTAAESPGLQPEFVGGSER